MSRGSGITAATGRIRAPLRIASRPAAETAQLISKTIKSVLLSLAWGPSSSARRYSSRAASSLPEAFTASRLYASGQMGEICSAQGRTGQDDGWGSWQPG